MIFFKKTPIIIYIFLKALISPRRKWQKILKMTLTLKWPRIMWKLTENNYLKNHLTTSWTEMLLDCQILIKCFLQNSMLIGSRHTAIFQKCSTVIFSCYNFFRIKWNILGPRSNFLWHCGISNWRKSIAFAIFSNREKFWWMLAPQKNCPSWCPIYGMLIWIKRLI